MVILLDQSNDEGLCEGILFRERESDRIPSRQRRFNFWQLGFFLEDSLLHVILVHQNSRPGICQGGVRGTSLGEGGMIHPQP